MDMHDYINRAVKIGEKEGEITKICGNVFEVTYFNLNDGKTYVAPENIEKYLN